MPAAATTPRPLWMRSQQSPLAPTPASRQVGDGYQDGAPSPIPLKSLVDAEDEPEPQLSYEQSQCNAVLNAVAFLYPHRPPTDADKHAIEDPENPRTFFPAVALQQLAYMWNGPDGPCGKVLERFQQLPWAAEWMDRAVRRAQYDRLVHKITNSNRVRVMGIYYPTNPPADDDAVAVALENNDVWQFKAAEWLREMLDAWESGSSKLSVADRERLEALPWFRGWMEREEDARRAMDLQDEQRAKQQRFEQQQSRKRQRLATGSPVVGAVA